MPSDPRAALLEIFAATIAAAQAGAALKGHLPPPPTRGRVLLFGTGKAGAAMVAEAERHYLDNQGLDPARLGGLAVCRHGYGAATRMIPVVEAGHPAPDEAGLAATARVLELAATARAEDLAVVLISGGGSANWVAPAGAITLAEKRAVTKALQRSGADINELNCVRKHMSRIKGGRLAKALAPARVVSLAISDVPGDDPSVIASGPTVPDPTTQAQARAILARHGVAIPPALAAVLADPREESVKPGDPAFARAAYTVVLRPVDALKAALGTAERLGYRPVFLGADVEGEAREVAAAHARMALDHHARAERVAIVSGGELTVTVSGRGRGGPNQEYALGLALALQGAAGIHALAADTDGTDGGAGSASDPAGAVIGPDTLARAAAIGLDPARSLDDNDATGFFEPLGDLVSPGPTLTNVNDLRVLLIDP